MKYDTQKVSQALSNLMDWHRLTAIQLARILDTHPMYIHRIKTKGHFGLVFQRKLFRVSPRLNKH